MKRIYFGVILLFIQAGSYLASILSKSLPSFDTFSLGALYYFFTFNFWGIIGLILLICGIVSIKKKNNQDEESNE